MSTSLRAPGGTEITSVPTRLRPKRTIHGTCRRISITTSRTFSKKSKKESAGRGPLCDNDVETSHPREFTLEGRGQCIRWLCPLSLTNTIRLLPAALKQKEAVGRPS